MEINTREISPVAPITEVEEPCLQGEDEEPKLTFSNDY